MDLGYSITTAVPPETDATAFADTIVERTRAAADAGFDSVQVGDHHSWDGTSYLQSIPMTARLAGVIDRVVPMFLLPVWDPIVVAEQVGTLAALAEVDVWYTVGRADNARTMGIDPRERAARIEEAIPLIDRLWSEDHVTADGAFYPVEDITVRPAADPRVVVGGTAEPAVRRAGRLADAWVANAHVPTADIAERVGWVEAAGGGDVLVRRDALVLPDGDRARDLAADLLAEGYRGWPADADWVLVGDADDVAGQLAALGEAGADEVVVRPMSGDHATETLRGVARSRDRL